MHSALNNALSQAETPVPARSRTQVHDRGVLKYMNPLTLENVVTSQPNHALQLETAWTSLDIEDPAWQPEETGDISKARFILNRLFQDYQGAFAIRLWNGSMLYIGDSTPAFTFCLERASVLRDMVLFSDPLRLAEAYFSGEIQIQGDFNAAMQLRDYFEALSLPLHEKLGLVFRALTLVNNHAEPASHEDAAEASATQALTLESATSPHLDYRVSADFFRLWLDEHMMHSCAYFSAPGLALAQAQQHQLELICQKLHLQHGEHLLDLGCGWGGLACWAAKHYGVFVHAITDNPAQYAYVTEQVRKQGLQSQVTVECRIYQQLPDIARYHKVACINTTEPVGMDQLPDYLAKIHAVLKPGGLFLCHGVTLENPHAPHTSFNQFIHRQIFPKGELSGFADVLQQMESARFEVFNVQSLRRHFALTLRSWLDNLEASHVAVAALAGERTFRMWRLYMTACAIQFEQGVTGIHQILATRR